jgi:hypothetical protein
MIMKKNLNRIIMSAIVTIAFASCTVISPVAISRAELGDSQGISETISVFGILFNGNYGVKEAAENGFINSAIGAIDEKTTSYFFFSKKQLIVTAK